MSLVITNHLDSSNNVSHLSNRSLVQYQTLGLGQPSYLATNPEAVPDLDTRDETRIVQAQADNGNTSPKFASFVQALGENFVENIDEEKPLAEASEKAEEVVTTISSPTNRVATLSKTAEEVLGSQKHVHPKTLKSLSSLGKGAGLVGESAYSVAQPLSLANNARGVLDSEATTEERVMSGASLASDTAYAARTLGAASKVGTGASTLKPLANLQTGLASKAAGTAGVLGQVGRAAPVIGGAVGAVSGGLQIRDAFKTEEGEAVDKAEVASGALKVASGVALAIPGGLPVSAALGLTAMAIDHRETLGKGAKAVGRGLKKGAEAVGGLATKGAEAAKDVTQTVQDNVRDAAVNTGKKTARGLAKGVGKAVSGAVKTRERLESLPKLAGKATSSGIRRSFGKGISAIHRRFSGN